MAIYVGGSLLNHVVETAFIKIKSIASDSSISPLRLIFDEHNTNRAISSSLWEILTDELNIHVSNLFLPYVTVAILGMFIRTIKAPIFMNSTNINMYTIPVSP